MDRLTRKFKRKFADENVQRSKPYDTHAPLNIDIRKYAVYITENHLIATDITPEIVEKFAIRTDTAN